MRTTFAVALAIASIASAAAAQTSRDPAAAVAKADARDKDPSYRAFERQLSADLARRKSELAATGTLADISAVEPARPPSSWTGTSDAWRLHLARCEARYRSYDPATDMYYATPTETRRCTL